MLKQVLVSLQSTHLQFNKLSLHVMAKLLFKAFSFWETLLQHAFGYVVSIKCDQMADYFLNIQAAFTLVRFTQEVLVFQVSKNMQ